MYAIVNRVTLELSVHWHSNLSVIEAECSFFFFGGGGGEGGEEGKTTCRTTVKSSQAPQESNRLESSLIKMGFDRGRSN